MKRIEILGVGGILPGDENSDHRPIPRLGEVWKEKEERPIISAAKRRSKRTKSSEVELDLSGEVSMAIW